MNRLHYACICIIMAILIVGVSGVHAATRHVPGDYDTIQLAIDSADPGDIVQVAPGTYNEQLTLKAGITLRGSGRESTTIDGGGMAPIIWVPADANANNTTIKGFTIQNGYDGTYYTHEGADSGIYCEWLGSATIEDNRINSLGWNGISVGYSSSNTIIRRNIIHGNLRHGIAINNADPIIGNNIIYDSTWAAIRALNFYSQSTIVNNTIVDNHGVEGWAKGVEFQNGSSALEFRNNIIAFNGGTGIHLYDHSSLSTPITLFYNTVFGNGLGHNEHIVLDGDTTVSSEPLFINSTARNYHLAADSLCRNAGDPSPADNDADGTRNDMGAYGGPNAMDCNCAGDLDGNCQVDTTDVSILLPDYGNGACTGCDGDIDGDNDADGEDIAALARTMGTVNCL